ncbi:MAG: BrnT family toxin [Deltaproteobacteria bacterium]|nr:BrnT family toxin [Deltaproteobacteria bacterium]MBW2697971.1 BrnT family toxin [Deltaproteobacteria bacterium]
MRIAWDPEKDEGNQDKHGVTFAEAQTVFEDLEALYIHDPDSADEERWVVIGMSVRIRLLTVVTWESDDEGIRRIISARRATQAETRAYAGKFS